MSTPDRCLVPLRPAGFGLVACLALTLTGLLGRSAMAQAAKADGPAKSKPAAPAEKAPAEKAPAEKAPAKPAPAKPAAKEKPAPSYVEEAVDPKPARRLDIQGLLRGKVAADQWAEIERYYTGFFLPRWTVVANRAEVCKWRDDLAKDVAVAKPPVRGDLLKLLLPKLVAMAKNPKVQPVARVNAMLMVGRLNAEEPENPWAGDPPVPLPEAQPHLLAALADAALPDAVKVAALVGIRRHAELGAFGTTEQKAAAANALLELANVAAPAPGRSPAAHGWMRALAVEALGDMKDPGPGGKVAKALVAIVGEAGAPFRLRCTAAEALGRLTFPEEPVIDPAVVVRQMGQLAVEAAGDELQRDGDGKGPLVRRRLQARLITIHNGLSGFTRAVTKTEDMALHTKVLESLKECLRTLEDKHLDDAALAAKLTQQVDALSQALAPPGAAAKEKPKEP